MLAAAASADIREDADFEGLATSVPAFVVQVRFEFGRLGRFVTYSGKVWGLFWEDSSLMWGRLRLGVDLGSI